jgi:hypothetical protein
VQQNISLSQKEYSFVNAQMVQLSFFKKFQNKTRIMTALTNIRYKGVGVEMQPKQNQVQVQGQVQSTTFSSNPQVVSTSTSVQQTSSSSSLPISWWNIAFLGGLLSLLK